MKHIKPFPKKLEPGDHVILKDKPDNIFIVTNTKDSNHSTDFYWVNITDVNNSNMKLEVTNRTLKKAKDYNVSANKYNL